MAKISFFMICETINNVLAPTGSTVPQLTNPFCVVRPEYIPGNYTFGIAVGVSGVNISEQNNMGFIIADPNNIVIQETPAFPLPIAPIDDNLPKDQQGFLLSFEARNLPLSVEGVYKITFYINGEAIGTEEIPIFPRKKHDRTEDTN